MSKRIFAAGLLCVLAVAACKHTENKKEDESKAQERDPNFVPPTPPVPIAPAFLPPVEDAKDNSTTPERVHLGWALFFDTRVSAQGLMACNHCHKPAYGFASEETTDMGYAGAMNSRNSPALLNLAYHTGFNWDGSQATLEAACETAWLTQLTDETGPVLERLNADPVYKTLFERAFGGPGTQQNAVKALATFLRAVKTQASPWDRFEAGDAAAVSEQAKQGFEVFRQAGCANCHTPPLYTDGLFHNTGLGMEQPEASRDVGLKATTKLAADEGRFKTPTLRNLVASRPYFHDGSGARLEHAVDVMLAGGRDNPYRDEKLQAFAVTPEQRLALLAFLRSLSGPQTYQGPPPDLNLPSQELR